MHQSLDTLIGFAVVMSVLSLLITIATQMISAACSMRGKNLANAMIVTFRTIDPRIAEHARSLADYVLSRPVLSDSLFAPRGPATAGATTNPDAIARAAAQAEAAALEAEEKNARAEIATAEAALETSRRKLLEAATAAGAAPAETKQHADAVVAAAEAERWHAAERLRLAKERHRQALLDLSSPRLKPALSTSTSAPEASGPRFLLPWVPFTGMKIANAVRADEVYRSLQRVAQFSPAEAARNGLSGAVPGAVSAMLANLGAPEALATEARRKVTAALTLADLALSEKQRADVLSAVGDIGEAIHTATAQGFDRFQRWFDSAQDRAQQWFTTHMRIATIVLGVAAAFWFQLDTVEIYRVISTDEATRNKLVAFAGPLLNESEKVLKAVRSPEQAALDELRKATPPLDVAEPSTPTRGAYQKAVAEACAAAARTDCSAVVAAFGTEVDKIAQARLNEASEKFKEVVSKFEETGFQLVPNGARWKHPDSSRNHLPGMLFTAGLLSRGAPFWVNLLKGLTNLRPAVARLVEAQPRQTPPPKGDPTSPR